MQDNLLAWRETETADYVTRALVDAGTRARESLRAQGFFVTVGVVTLELQAAAPCQKEPRVEANAARMLVAAEPNFGADASNE
jgi:hypothetical protein